MAGSVTTVRRAPRVVAAALVFVSLEAGAAGTTAVGNAPGREHAGDVISTVARIVRGFRLTKVSSDMEVLADHMEFDYEKGRLSYSGNVRVTHGGVYLETDLLTITFEPGSDKPLENIHASGNVTVDYGDEKATGESATYDPRNATLTLSGTARVGSGRSSVEGDSVIVYLDEGRAVVEGGSKGPVRALIDPESLDVDEILE